jgi:hypothetical protein
MVWTRGSFVYFHIKRSVEDEEFYNEVQQDGHYCMYVMCARVRSGGAEAQKAKSGRQSKK